MHKLRRRKDGSTVSNDYISRYYIPPSRLHKTRCLSACLSVCLSVCLPVMSQTYTCIYLLAHIVNRYVRAPFRWTAQRVRQCRRGGSQCA